MNRIKKLPPVIFIYGAIVALLLGGASLLIMSPKQCPLDYTQEQADVANCIAGANIGLGIILAIGIWITAILIALGISISRKNKKTS